jgi:hypothetical protein
MLLFRLSVRKVIDRSGQSSRMRMAAVLPASTGRSEWHVRVSPGGYLGATLRLPSIELRGREQHRHLATLVLLLDCIQYAMLRQIDGVSGRYMGIATIFAIECGFRQT